MSADEPNLKAFGKILSFMRDLNSAFGNDHPDVNKYYTLCKKTTFDNTKAITKQVSIFYDYCNLNKGAIKQSSMKDLCDADIAYNEKFNFNVKKLLGKADKDTIKAVFDHLQVISVACNIENTEEIKTALIQKAASKPKKDLFTELMNDVQEDFASGAITSDNGISMQGIQNTIEDYKQSGKMEGLVEKISKMLGSGECSEEELMSGAFGMLQNVKEQAGDDPQMAGIMNMVTGLFGQMGSLGK
jgi:hypothetical protein